MILKPQTTHIPNWLMAGNCTLPIRFQKIMMVILRIPQSVQQCSYFFKLSSWKSFWQSAAFLDSYWMALIALIAYIHSFIPWLKTIKNRPFWYTTFVFK